MVHRGQRKLLLMLAAMVVPCIGTVGCQIPMGPVGSAINGNGSYPPNGGLSQYPPGVTPPIGSQVPSGKESVGVVAHAGQYQSPGGYPQANLKSGPNGLTPLDSKGLPTGLPVLD